MSFSTPRFVRAAVMACGRIAMFMVLASGSAVALATDTDKDGISDSFDSAPTDITKPGYTPLYNFSGTVAGEGAVWGVASADVNQDGYPDIIVGLPYILTSNGANSGIVKVYSGLDGSLLWSVNGDAANDFFGYAISAGGDVNQDGYPDVVVGAFGHNTSTGRVKVLSGLDGSVLYTFDGMNTGDQLGAAVSSAGDINKDGYDDVAVGALWHNASSGQVRIYSGADGSLLYVFNGQSPFDHFGASVAASCDINRDGYADIIVGAPYNDHVLPDAGAVQVFSGKDSTLLYTWYGSRAGANLGASVTCAGDMNGDGFADVAAGAPLDANPGYNSGTVRVYSGRDGSTLYTFGGDVAGDQLGNTVSAAGDVNGDGFADLVAGIHFADYGFINSGGARVYSGKDGSILLTLTGQSISSGMGVAVSGAGDVNHDGYADVIVSAPTNSVNSVAVGTTYVYSGASAAALMDTDGDGINDNADNCPAVSNASQLDTDSDGHGDACDAFPADPLRWLDTDGDGVADNYDNCPSIANPTQQNTNGTAAGDACDAATVDTDLDGLPDWMETLLGTSISNPDTDGDGLLDSEDPYPLDNVLLNDARGGNSLDLLGAGVAITDMNNDGYADLVVGAPGAEMTINGSVNVDVGMINIISGRDGRTLNTFTGTTPSQRLGGVFAIVPDQDLDLVPDIVAGFPLADVTTLVGTKTVVMKAAGRVDLYSGATGAFIATIAEGTHAGDHLGASVAAGNVDGLGPKLVVGIPQMDVSTVVGTKTVVLKDAGQVIVYTDIASGTVLYTRSGTQAREHFGSAVAVDEPLQELFVGSPTFDYKHVVGTRTVNWVDAGRVQVFAGANGTSGPVFTGYGSAARDQFGSAVTSYQGDVTGDSQPDWAVGSAMANIPTIVGIKTVVLKAAGKVEIFSGFNSSVPVDVIVGKAAKDNLGAALSAGGDINKDGKSDLAIGTPHRDITTNVGGVVLTSKSAGYAEILNSTAL